MTSAQNARSLATANKKMDLSRQTEHEIAAPLSPDGPHHAPGRRRADPTTVRIEASVGVQTSRFFEDGQSRHVGLDNFGLLIEASCGLASLVPRARPLDHPPIRGPKRRRLTLPRDLPPQPQLRQTLAGEMRVVAAVEVDARPLGQRPQRLGRRSQGGDQERRVVAALAGALTAPSGMPEASTAIERLCPVCPCPPGFFRPSPLRLLCLGDAAVHGHLREFQADEVVVGVEADLPESLHHSKLDPLIPPSLRSVLSEQDASAILLW